MKLTAAIAVLLTAASAGATGFIAGRNLPERRATDIPTRLEIVDAMADEVGLDPAQHAAVIRVSDRHCHSVQEVRRKVAGELAAIRSDVRAETRAIMNEGQRRRFDAYCVRRDEQRARADR